MFKDAKDERVFQDNGTRSITGHKILDIQVEEKREVERVEEERKPGREVNKKKKIKNGCSKISMAG